ncbi:MAG: tRNA (adenosine(37)-N6)-threonylcarbamoyltransferase complex dimerization subunit type 1 TsaB, partial [Terracidiphilus sp.]
MSLPLSHSAPLLLAIDTCGPSGSVALGRVDAGAVTILAERALEGRTYSATLVAAVAEMLAAAGGRLNELAALVAVNGPGSFTGVRVGLGAVKGLAEPGQIPVVALSRLEVLAREADVASAALDAHRHEIYLRLAVEGADPDPGAQELLAGVAELAALEAPSRVAVCDPGAVELLASAWPRAELV